MSLISTKIAIFAVTERGTRLAMQIAEQTDGDLFLPQKLSSNRSIPYTVALSDLMGDVFGRYRHMVFVMATGIVCRVIAPHICSKYTDPAVVVVDESARYVISLLSGHEGGANELAYLVGSMTGASPVVTTATEANKVYIMGIGCRKFASSDSIVHAVKTGCEMAGTNPEALRCLASVDIKKDEPGLIEAAKSLGLYLRFIPKWMVRFAAGLYQESTFVYSKIGIAGVCEPSALLAGCNTSLVLRKQIIGPVTVALAKEELYAAKYHTEAMYSSRKAIL
jgi:cobalt-precorrin 5A hydrolase